MNPHSSKKLLVAGAAGFIGSNFVRVALRRGYSVVGVDALTYAGHRENLEGVQEGSSFRFVQGDMGDRTLVAELLRVEHPAAIVNFAAETHVDRSIHDPLRFVENNVLATARFLEEVRIFWHGLGGVNAADQAAFRFLQVSTDEVYGSLGEAGLFSETSPLDPSSPYSASKAAADHLVFAWAKTYGLPVLVTRCSNNYGPYQWPEKLIPRLIQNALAGLPLPIYGDGQHVRDWIHVEDHCAGVLLALEKGKTRHAYCFGGHREEKNLELARKLCRILDELKPRDDGTSYCDLITFVADRPGHDFRYAVDDSFAKRELGYHPHFSFEEGLRQTVRWYLDHQDWAQKVT